MAGFLKEQLAMVTDGKICHDTVLQHRKAATMLADCMQGRPLVWKHKTNEKAMTCDYFRKILGEYKIHLSQTLSAGTIKYHIGIARQLFAFLESCGLYDFNGLASENIKDFITIAAPKHKSSMKTLTGVIKKVLAYLNDVGLISVNADRYLVNPAPSRKKLFPCFTDDEADAIIKLNK